LSTIGNVFDALRSVILLQSRIDQLDQRMARMSGDMEGLTESMYALRDRISRLEGMIEGAAMARGSAQSRIEAQ
jgi:hypothetical protein